MAEQYDQAALRHFQDASLLENNRRLANADQLYGLAAECALKWVWPKTGTPLKKKHIDELWEQVRLSSKTPPCLITLLRQPNPFADWSVEQRYEKDSVVTQSSIDQHRQIAKRLLGAVRLLGVSP
ncbi:MAG: hypothetical protein H7835_06220 [Magnetococcus sp. XQGC-1]